ncbi:MAG: carboxypeptidase regulatory-like domain-containing protein, partial [Candidatus Cloacimonadales bacterium]
MKKNMLIVLAILMTLTSIFAMDIEIGNGTIDNYNSPVTGLWDYSWSNFIISSNQIGMAAEFNQIQFNVSTVPTNYTFVGQKIYFKETAAVTVTAAYPNPETSGFTLVYQGDVTFDGSGFQGVMLNTPFAYTGTSNLQIVWENHDGSWTSGYPSFLHTDVGTNVGAYHRTDTTFPTADGTIVTYFPNLILSFAAENEPTMVTLVAPADNAMNIPASTTLQWTMGQNTTNVDVYFSADRSAVNNMEASALVVNAQNVTSYQANNLEMLTDYYWRVKSRNTANDLVVAGPVWKFSTEAGGGIVAVPIGDGTASDYKFPWNFYYKSSVAETIYLAEELNIGGLLQGLSFYNSFATNITGTPVSIWVGETTQSDLTDYIPASNLTLVFDGNMDFPSGQNTINVMFDTPYNYAGGNLVVLTHRPLDTEWYSSSDKFYNTETALTNRTVSWQSDTIEYDPNAMTGGTRVNRMPNAVFYFVVDGMGSVSGTVTDGTTGLGGVNISIDNTSYHAVSLPDGSFEFPYVAEDDDYTLTASLHGYHNATATFDVEEDEETIVNLTMTMLANVTVTGQVITNDTSQGIQAHVVLTGYETYEVDSDANGNFTIPGVFSNQTYTGTATAEGYQPGTFTAVVAATNLNVGTVLVTEILYPATNVVATLTGNNALIAWGSPAFGSGEAVTESFEEGFPPEGWTTVVNNTTESWAQYETIVFSSGDVVPTDGTYQAGVMWDYAHQDEWLITSEMNCPTGDLTFDFYGHNGSVNGDNYYVKVSTDGTNWTPIWNASDLPDADNHYDAPVVIDLSDYTGQNVQFAWNFVDGDGQGLWYATYIDNIHIGGTRVNTRDLLAVSRANNKTNNADNINTSRMTSKRNPNEVSKRVRPVAQIADSSLRNNDRALIGYKVWRFLTADETTQANWTLLTTTAITDTTYTDATWSAQPAGFYKYAVKSIYTSGAEANPAISNWVQNSVMNTVTVNVESNLGGPIADANIVLTAQVANPNGEFGVFEATTNAAGTAIISVNTGMYNAAITAIGFTSYAGEVNATANVVVNVTLNEVALPPSGVVAEQEGADAVITWGEPGGAGGGEWITKGAEENNDGIGTGAAAVISVSQKYTQAELEDYQGMFINSIKFFPREGTSAYTLSVWGGTAGNTVLHSQVVTNFTNEAWNEVELTSSVAIPATGPVYFGYVANTPAGYPAGCDAGPAVAGGDMIKLGDQAEWDVLSVITTINVNWNLQAYVSWGRGATVASEGKTMLQRHNPHATSNAQIIQGNLDPIVNQTSTKITKATTRNDDRALVGYKVWRLLAIDQGNENNWTLLTPTTITGLTHTDTGWNAMTSGSYKFAVKAIYTNDNLSPAAFSNVLLKDMYGTVDGIVKNESDAPISGAVIHLDGRTATTNAQGSFEFLDVLAGDYDITATANGYASSTQNITVVGTQVTSAYFILATTNILISDSFETYPDFALTADPWVLFDGDLSPTYGFTGVQFPNTGSAMSYIVFNPTMTTP